MAWNGNAEAQRQADEAYAKLKPKRKARKGEWYKKGNGTYYQQYMRSNEWKIKARNIRTGRGNKCEHCGRRSDLDVHHLTYERLGRELNSDLVVLCRSCHLTMHEDKAACESKLTQEFARIAGGF